MTPMRGNYGLVLRVVPRRGFGVKGTPGTSEGLVDRRAKVILGKWIGRKT